MDPRINNLAKILVNYSIDVQQGEWILVRSHMLAAPLARVVTEHIYRAGGHPTILYGDDELEEIKLREASDEQLQWISPAEMAASSEIDAYIALQATANTRFLTGIDPARQQLAQLGRSKLLETYRKRIFDESLRWVGARFPCPAYSQDADMSLREYEDFVYGATYADQPDPVKYWQDVHNTQQRLVDWLAGKKEVVARGPNVDLTLSIEGRKFINSDGHNNMPSGEIYTSPVEDSANGWIKFSYPAVRLGREVEGVAFQFENGKVVSASAAKNEAYLLSQLDSDEGARYLGEFAIGTNYGIQQFTKSILFDEKIGGTMHIAVGNGFPYAGGKNKSIIHWDFICDMREESEILVDGELFYKNGQFQI